MWWIMKLTRCRIIPEFDENRQICKSSRLSTVTIWKFCRPNNEQCNWKKFKLNIKHFSRFNFPAAGNENGGEYGIKRPKVRKERKQHEKHTFMSRLTIISVDVAAHFFNFVESSNERREFVKESNRLKSAALAVRYFLDHSSFLYFLNFKIKKIHLIKIKTIANFHFSSEIFHFRTKILNNCTN